MSRLIDAEALKKAIEDSDTIHCVTNLWYKDILKEIDNAPTVEINTRDNSVSVHHEGFYIPVDNNGCTPV